MQLQPTFPTTGRRAEQGEEEVRWYGGGGAYHPHPFHRTLNPAKGRLKAASQPLQHALHLGEGQHLPPHGVSGHGRGRAQQGIQMVTVIVTIPIPTLAPLILAVGALAAALAPALRPAWQVGDHCGSHPPALPRAGEGGEIGAQRGLLQQAGQVVH